MAKRPSKKRWSSKTVSGRIIYVPVLKPAENKPVPQPVESKSKFDWKTWVPVIILILERIFNHMGF